MSTAGALLLGLLLIYVIATGRVALWIDILRLTLPQLRGKQKQNKPKQNSGSSSGLNG